MFLWFSLERARDAKGFCVDPYRQEGRQAGRTWRASAFEPGGLGAGGGGEVMGRGRGGDRMDGWMDR